MAQFPEKLYNILCDPSNREAISWVHGTAFIVNDRRRLELEVLPKYFRHAKLTSFQRQLSLYGIKRNSDEAYSHPLLQEGRSDLVHQMKRKSRNKDSGDEGQTGTVGMDTSPYANEGDGGNVFNMGDQSLGGASGGGMGGGMDFGAQQQYSVMGGGHDSMGNLGGTDGMGMGAYGSSGTLSIGPASSPRQGAPGPMMMSNSSQGNFYSGFSGPTPVPSNSFQSSQRATVSSSPIDTEFYNSTYYQQPQPQQQQQPQQPQGGATSSSGSPGPQLQLPDGQQQQQQQQQGSSSQSMSMQQYMLAPGRAGGPTGQQQHQQSFVRHGFGPDSTIQGRSPLYSGPPGWNDRAPDPSAMMTATSSQAFDGGVGEMMRPESLGSLGPADMEELSKPVNMRRVHSLAENPLTHTQSGDFEVDVSGISETW
jgi:hypothetical protein